MVEERRRLLAEELAPVAAGPVEAARAYSHLVEANLGLGFTDKESHQAKVAAIRSLMGKIAYEGGFSTWQTILAGRIGDALGMTETLEDSRIRWKDEGLSALQQVFLIKGGWGALGPIPDGVAPVGPDEGLHWGCPAACYREKVVTEIQLESIGGEAQVSERLSVEQATIRGHEVEVGREWALEDSGIVYATNLRVLFIGSRNSWSIGLDELIGLKVFSDGVRLLTHASDAEPLVVAEDRNHQLILVASIEQALKVHSGTGRRLGSLEGIPDFSEADPETEALLSRAASEHDWPDSEIRKWRMMDALGSDLREELRQRIGET